MAWKVKRRDANGALDEVSHEEWTKALESKSDFEKKGFEAWIEDEDGKPVDLSPDRPS